MGGRAGVRVCHVVVAIATAAALAVLPLRRCHGTESSRPPSNRQRAKPEAQKKHKKHKNDVP